MNTTDIQNIVGKLGIDVITGTNPVGTSPEAILKKWEEEIDTFTYDNLGDKINELTKNIYNEYDKKKERIKQINRQIYFTLLKFFNKNKDANPYKNEDEIKQLFELSDVINNLSTSVQSTTIQNDNIINYLKKVYGESLNFVPSDIVRNIFKNLTLFYDKGFKTNQKKFRKISYGVPYTVSIDVNPDNFFDKKTLELNQTNRFLPNLLKKTVTINLNKNPAYTIDDNYYIFEVIRFEDNSLFDYKNIRKAYYNNIFFILKGVYYYLCRGSGIFIKIPKNQILVALNKLQALEMLGINVLRYIKEDVKAIFDYKGITLPIISNRKYDNSKLFDNLPTCNPTETSINNLVKCSKEPVRQNFIKKSSYVTQSPESFGIFKKFIQDKETFNGKYNKYQLTYNGINLFNSKNNKKLWNNALKEYKNIYNQDWNQNSIDNLLFNEAVYENVKNRFILLTHEPQLNGTVGVELIDLLPTPIQSTIFSISKGKDFRVENDNIKCTKVEKYDLLPDPGILRASSDSTHNKYLN